jgi:acetyl-CoA C-acetyltransferase
MDDRWPVLVGFAERTQRDDALDAAGLMEAVLRSARADAGPGLAAPDLVLVPRGMWGHPDPGRAAALATGSTSVRSVIAEIGVLQSTLFSRAFTAIASGQAEVVAVLGAEARYRSIRGGVEAPGEGTPDQVLTPSAEIIGRVEAERGLGVPAHQYALIESILAHRAGRNPAEQTSAIAELWALGASAAAAQPGAWRRDGATADALASADGGNRMISTPYRKRLISDWTVDQAAGFVITSVATARAAGIPESRWIVPVAVAESNHMVTLSARDEPARSPAMEAVADALLAVGAPVTDADLVEIYSCFPAAVQVAAAGLGIDPWKGWTVTGGMTFGGGPLNNFVLQATAAVAQALRDGRGETAIVTAVSGMITKVGAIAWRRGEVPDADLGALSIDVSAAAAERTIVREVDADLAGELTIVAQTVVHDRGEPSQGIVLAESADGRRTVATSTDPAIIQSLIDEDLVGRGAIVDAGVITSIVTS